MPPAVKHTVEAKELVPAPIRTGRPKTARPQMPQFALSDYEQTLFDYFVLSFREPDFTAADDLLLWLAGVEFVKLLRVYGTELSTGEVISQARQHPGTMLNQYLDRLSVTRKQREKKPKDEDDPNAHLLSQFG